MGKEGQIVPEMSDEWVDTISKRYIELYETITGHAFQPEALSKEDMFDRISKKLERL
jgi:phosphoribosylaminoimidazole-succinocarboxamide synthase